jgi:Zn-dependent protease with chaperone function
MPVNPGYPTWCDRCDWNLDLPESWQVQNWHQQLYFNISNAISLRLFRKITATGPAQPKITFPKVVALIVAILVHIITLTVALSGIWLLYNTYSNNLLLPFVGLLLCSVAFMMRPRLGRLPRYNILSRQQFSALYKLTDQISAHLGTRKVDFIVVATYINASFHTVGWSRKSVLTLGLPLLEILTPQERVALIGHELAHGANGDASRTFVIGNAIGALNSWRDLFTERNEGTLFIYSLAILLLGVPWFIAVGFRFIAITLGLLLANDSQRAEYLADKMGAQEGGTEAMLNVLHKLHMGDALGATITRFYEMGSKWGVFEALRRKVEHVPMSEIERVARIEELRGIRLDASHPPATFRMKILKVRPAEQPRLALETTEIEAIEREFTKIRAEIESIMLEEYRTRSNT